MMRRVRRGPARSAQTLTIPVTATAAGAVAPNAFSGWQTPATTITSLTQFGSTDKYIGGVVGTQFIAKTTSASRDHEFRGWFSRGRVFIRLTDGGRCFFLEHSAQGNFIQIALCEGITEGTFDGSSGTAGASVRRAPLLYGQATSLIPNYTNSSTSGAYFTFGCSGFEVYAAFNGVEFFRYKSVYHCVPGRVALASRDGTVGNGFRDVTVELKEERALYGDPTTNNFDVRDFGCRPSVSDTGSIAAGSTALTVTDGSRWEVGDYVVVETGGEPNFGVFGNRGGTRGVGGQWPSLIYNTLAAMNSDTSQVTNKVCGVLEDGYTYQWSAGAWRRYADYRKPIEGPVLGFSYFARILPRALLAKVVSKAGNVLTLNTAASISTTNANVYLNCYRHYNELLGSVQTAFVPDLGNQSNYYVPTPATMNWPAGSYAWGAPSWHRISIGQDWHWRGAGQNSTTIFSPDGTISLWIELTANDFPARVSNIKFVGNGRLDKACFGNFAPITDEWDNTFGQNIKLHRVSSGEVADVTCVDGMQAAIVFDGCYNTWMRRITAQHATGHDRYMQWQVQILNSTICGGEDITLDFAKCVSGLEAFQSTGTVFRRVSGRNATVSSNSNSAWDYDQFDLYLEVDCMTAGWPVRGNFWIDINSNASNTNGLPTTGGGTFRNFRLRQLGLINIGLNHVTHTIGFSGGTFANILGQYPLKPAPTLGGYIEQPATQLVCIRNDSVPNVTIDGVRCVITGGGIAKISGINGGAMPSSTIVRNCVVDLVGANATSTNNISNPVYEAL